jgi:SAM-dependent methyltransferase
MRVRALAALLSTEIFGVPMSLPEFPKIQAVRGIGMSDTPEFAARLAEKFDYTNTFYHQAPFFDVTRPEEGDAGRFDFIVSSEVMEHVPGPVEDAFATLARLLKPDGVLLMTTPYAIEGKTAEHFPELHQYTLASAGGEIVLINRRRDGELEVFRNLTFHGGPGATLELRIFSEESLRRALACAGFKEIRIASESLPEFGVEHTETWSLPIAARKGRFVPPFAELALKYREARRRAESAERELGILTGEYERHVAYHNLSHQQMQEWGRKLDAELEDRNKWALNLQKERAEAIQHYEQAHKSELEAWECVQALEKELDEARARNTWLESHRWTRLGRKLRVLS